MYSLLVLVSHGCNDDKLRTPYDSINIEYDINPSVTILEQPDTAIIISTKVLLPPYSVQLNLKSDTFSACWVILVFT